MTEGMTKERVVLSGRIAESLVSTRMACELTSAVLMGEPAQNCDMRYQYTNTTSHVFGPSRIYVKNAINVIR
ncbi:hypothetical protein VP1G_10706 [Cytospora mali]|uniref:Uncharacterized protein n=1 Tax=Cytospora mali TaxID=578113 RepID=A0A194UTC4_CYTMA|nr:hypothetical protein VP1G_10706 [Valsa mali var. pyri (nom. inval.)]